MITSDVLRASWRTWLYDDYGREGPYWLQLVWTLLFCMAVAVGFTLLGFASFDRSGQGWHSAAAWAHWYPINLVVSLVIGFMIHGLYELGAAVIGRPRLRRWSRGKRALYYAGVPIFSVLVGWPIGAWLVSERSGVRIFSGGVELAGAMMAVSMMITLLMYLWFESRSRQIEAERRATEARLQLLQAQIEPHFLFNTLAHVESLIEADPPRARQMLEHFGDYLRASLGELRSESSTLGAELDMAEAYLRLMRLRMGERLRFAIEADDALRRLPMAPLLLQPLVENAITHGLEPQVDGGQVTVRAHRQGEVLTLEVHDDGAGMAPERPSRPGHGLALRNLRERLAARHGREASLALAAGSPGTRAVIQLPIEEAA